MMRINTNSSLKTIHYVYPLLRCENSDNDGDFVFPNDIPNGVTYGLVISDTNEMISSLPAVQIKGTICPTGTVGLMRINLIHYFVFKIKSGWTMVYLYIALAPMTYLLNSNHLIAITSSIIQMRGFLPDHGKVFVEAHIARRMKTIDMLRKQWHWYVWLLIANPALQDDSIVGRDVVGVVVLTVFGSQS